MANSQVLGRKDGAAWIFMLVAVAAIAGLMIWLSAATEGATTRVVLDDEASEVEAVQAEPLENVVGVPDQFIGQRVRAANVPVASVLGPRAFWVDAGANQQVLVLVGTGADLAEARPGDMVGLRGRFDVAADSLVDRWIESGAVRPEAREDALFALHYVLADSAAAAVQ